MVIVGCVRCRSSGGELPLYETMDKCGPTRHPLLRAFIMLPRVPLIRYVAQAQISYMGKTVRHL